MLIYILHITFKTTYLHGTIKYNKSQENKINIVQKDISSPIIY